MVAIYMGLDYGKRSIGVAIGQTITKTADPLKVVTAQKGVPNWAEMDELIKRYQPKALVLGWPLNMDGSEQNLTKAVAVFQKNLEKRYGLSCYTVDERLTTYEAKQLLGKKKGNKAEVDMMSAVLILEAWLNTQPDEPVGPHE